MSTLVVLVDGKPLGADLASALWKRFSAWMEEHPSDLAGFAASEGYASIHPEMHDGSPVLVASRSAPQRAYGVAPKRPKTGGGGGAGSKRRR